jgi:DNA invertase Pin-like site-specific DNA recombinase
MILAGLNDTNYDTILIQFGGVMSRVFAYCRVSTVEQTTDNQILAIENAGYTIEPSRVIAETISGKTSALKRTKFSNLVEHKLEPTDTLIVQKLDRLGRDSIDVQTTVNYVLEKGVKLIVLDLPEPDLSTPNGKLLVGMFSVFAEFERNRISERTRDGQARAIAQGKRIGRPEATTTTKHVQDAKKYGLSQSKVAKKLGISIPTVKRHWNKELSFT